MSSETNTLSAPDFGPEDIELLGRQLAERGFYVIGRLAPMSRKPPQTPALNSRPNPKATRPG